MNRSSSKRERVSSGKVAMMAGLLSALPGLATVALPGNALAVDVFSDWTTAVDGNWEDAGNWTPAQAPANGIDNYFVNITASGTPYTIYMNSGFSLSDLVLDSPDVTLSLQPGANALNIGGAGGITVNQGTLSFDGGVTFVPFINVANPSQFVFNSGWVGINGNSQVIPLDGTSLFNDLSLAWGQSLFVQAADGSYSSGINLTPGSTLTIDGGGLWVNLLQSNGGSFVFNQGYLNIDNPFDTFVVGASGLLAGDFTNTWDRSIRHTGTVQVENGATLTLESGSLEIGALDLSQGGIFNWQAGRLTLLNDVVIEDGNSTAPFSSGGSLNADQHFAIGGNLTIGDTAMGVFFLSGYNQSDVEGNLYIGRAAGSDNSQLWVGDPYNSYNSGYLYVQGDVFVGGDGFTEGGFSDLNIGPYSNFTTDGLLYIHSSSSVSVTDYSYLTAGRIIWEGSRNLSDAYITLTDTFEVIVDDNYDNNNGADESNPFGSNLTISDGGSIRELSVNNFLSIGAHGGMGYLTVQGDGRLIVGNALTFGSGAMVDIDMYGGYYYYGGLIEADDINTFDANPANLRFYNANFQLNTINSLVIDPSAYQFGSEVYVDGSFQREDPNNPGNFIDYNFNYINVPNGQIIVGNTGYGHLVVGNYTQGVETQYMFIGGNAIGADGHVEVSNSNSEYDYNYDNYFYRGIVISNYVNLGAFDTDFTNTLDIDNYGGVWVGGDLTIGSTTSTNATLTGELTQNYYSDLIVGGTFTVNQYGRYRGENFGTLAVGSFNIDPNADFSIFGINLIISNDDLTIAAGELFGDTILVDPSGSNFHAEDPNVTLLTGLELRNGNLNVGASFGKLTVQDPNGYYNFNNSVRIYGTTTVADGAELHILDNGRFSTGSLIVDPNGLFNWEDGYFELTADDLVIDSINGSLPIGDNVIINDYGLTPSRRGLSVSNNHLTVGESGNGELQIFSGYVDAARMTIGGGNGGIGKVTVSGNSYYSTLSINNDDINLGGDEFASFGANSAILTINDYGAVNVYDGVVRIWDNHQIILNGGTLNTQNIIKDDGTGIFTPANFDFISGDLNLTDANVIIDNDNLLGNFVDLVSGKSLNVNSYSIYDPNLGTYVYPNGLTTVKSGATLKVNGGSFTTRRLVIEPGGNFELLGGTFQLSGDDLIIDPVTGQLPELVNPGSTSIRVTGGKLIVGDVDFGLMDLSSGTMSSQGAQFGRNIGSTFTVSVGKPDGSVYNSINQYSSGNELVVGGTDTAAGGTGIFTIYKNASVNYDYSNMRIWDGSRVILDGGFLRLNDILKDDGTGTFNNGPTPDFAYNSGNLYLRSNQTLDTGTALGPDLDIDGSKLLEINALLTIADSAMLDLTGGTLTVNQMQKVGTGSFNFTAGTLNLRQQDAVVDSVNPSFFLGDNFALGAGTRLNVTNYGFGLVVGQDGNGEMSFNGAPQYWNSGGVLSYGTIYVGKNAGSMGTINVGDGTTAGYLETFTSAYIGDQGQATLNVLSGGYAHLRTAYFAANPGSVANVTVNNATLNTFNANVGGDGVTDGGMANIYVQNGASWSMSGSTLNLHSGGNVYIQGGSLNTGYIGELGGGIHYTSGTLQVNYQGLTIGQGQVLGAAVTIPTLSSIIVGQSNSQTSFTIADGGSVVNHGNLNAYAVNVQQGGALSGNGQLNHVSYFGFANGGGLRVENAGTLSPGNSAGIMTIAASWYGTRFIQTSTGNIEIEIGGNANGAPVAGTHYDQLIVHGNLFLDGTLDLLGLPGPYGELTDVYQIIRYTGTRTGEFGTINWFNGFAGNIAYDVNVGGGWKAITITNIPEPTTMLLLAVGGTMLLGRRRAG